MQRIKERLVLRRNALNLSQVALAEKSGVSARAIAAYETGESTPSGSRLDKLAQALYVSPAWLIGADESVLQDKSRSGSELNLQDLPPTSLETLFDSLGEDYKQADEPERERLLDLIDSVLAELKRRRVSMPERAIIHHQKRKPPSSPLTSEEREALRRHLSKAVPDDAVPPESATQPSTGVPHPHKAQQSGPSSSATRPQRPTREGGGQK